MRKKVEFNLSHRSARSGFGSSDRDSGCTGCDTAFNMDERHTWTDAQWIKEARKELLG